MIAPRPRRKHVRSKLKLSRDWLVAGVVLGVSAGFFWGSAAMSDVWASTSDGRVVRQPEAVYRSAPEASAQLARCEAPVGDGGWRPPAICRNTST